MTEKAAGADATGMQTTAVKDGNENYILNGEKWFSSSASVADMALVMAKTDPNAPRHKQYSTFIVELPNPGYKIKRNIKNMAIEGPHYDQLSGGHSEIEIRDLKVPADNLLGGEGKRLQYGPAPPRLRPPAPRHAQHRESPARPRAHVTKRSTFGVLLADRQAVQFMLAECASQLYIGRLMLLHIAYKAENGLDLTQENSIAKVYLAHMVHKVIDTAIQLHGAPRLQPGHHPGEVVHASPLAAAGRRPRRSAQMEGRPQRHQGVPRARHHGAGRGRRFDLNFQSSFRTARNARRSGISRLLNS